MSKYNFVLYAAQSADFIEKLRSLGLVDITVKGWEPSDDDRRLLMQIEEHGEAFEFLRRFRDEGRCDANAEPLASGAESYTHYKAAQHEAAVLTAEVEHLRKLAEEMRPWGEFSAERVARLYEEGVALHFFFASQGNFEQYRAEWSENYTLVPIESTESTAYFVIITPVGESVMLDAQEMKLPKMDIREVEMSLAQAEKELAALDAEHSRIAASEDLLRQNLALLKERLQDVRIEATAVQAADGALMVMEGWAETKTSERVDALLEQYPNVVYLKGDPTPEDDTPVKLNNNRFARIFELLGDMYARPKYGTIDLTPFFAPFYVLFFGVCLNDAGYGAILTLMGLWLLVKNREGMMHRAALFATLCGVSTVAVGLVSGSVFGIDLRNYFTSVPFFDFEERFFSIALAIGVVQISLGLILRAVMLASTLGFRYALGTLGWVLIVVGAAVSVGVPLLNPGWVIPLYTPSSPAFYATLAVGGVLMFFFNSPGKNLFINFGVGLWHTYNNLSGIMADVLSYLRLFAIGLAGGVLAMVFNALASGFVPEGAGIAVRLLIMIPVLLIGHSVNLFMSLIAAFVHPLRLTFVEFFKNAGFEMAGRSFEPLSKIKL